MPERALREAGFVLWRFTPEHFAARVSEWFMAAIALLMGVGMALQPDLFARNPGFAGLATIADQGVWMLTLLTVALVRLAALVINGAWRRSPWLRAATASVSAFVWWTLLLGVLLGMWRGGLPGLGWAFYVPMIALDLFNVYRAMRDAGTADKAAVAKE